MHLRKISFILLPLLGFMLLASAFFLWPSGEASAQCGSQASSCKNCHEVQGQDPVNNDGSGWHQNHAFGDFCYICHGGNNQSMVAEEAHAGMMPVMADVETACQSCHPADLMERAEVFAAVLGVPVGTGGASGDPPPAEPSANKPSGADLPPAGNASGITLAVDDSEVVDYAQRYNETVLGVRTINWGNVIVGLLIVLVAIGGGAFIYYNERKLRGLPLAPSRKSQADPAVGAAELPQVDGYDSEVVALLPLISQLDPLGRHALKRLLQNPEDASQLLHSLSRLDPELVRRLRSLDRESRSLLVALSGD